MIILGIKYNDLNFKSAVKSSLLLLAENGKASIYFLNADCLYKAQRDQEYRDALSSADLVFPDGIGLKLATKMLGGRMEEDCNGTDFSPLLMQKAAEERYKIYFLGSKEEIAEKAAENTRKQIPGIQIVGTQHGFFNNNKEVIKKINDSGADILFVAMGVPLQEKWIAKHRGELTPRLCLGVGALFDYLSGKIPRAPLFMRKMHLEWLWRIFIEPKRMFKRYIIDGARLFWIVIKYKFTGQSSALK